MATTTTTTTTTTAADGPEYAIIGGGIAGLTLAIALLRRGKRITVYEQARRFGEVGAGVAFSPNAVRAMRVCADSIHAAFERVATRNQWPSKADCYFDYVHGVDGGRPLFTLRNPVGANSVHRADFLDELVKLVPADVCRFGKHLDDVTELPGGRLQMQFHDGSTAEADAVIGCDGIKSRVRQLVLGEDDPASYPHYSHVYAYRGLIPADKAIAAVGEELAVNSCIHMGPGGHVLTFPVSHGSKMNVVAFRHNAAPWPSSTKLTLRSSKAAAQADFAGWGPAVRAIIGLLADELDCWALFDTLAHEPRAYAAGRVVLVGDAAHATTPHLGAGAGFCIEDAAVLAELLADARTAGPAGVQAAFAAFEATRRARAQWLVRSSRFVGEAYDFMAVDAEGRALGPDGPALEAELRRLHDGVWHVDTAGMVAEARAALGRALAAAAA